MTTLDPGAVNAPTDATATNGGKPIINFRGESRAVPPRNIDRGQWRALTFALHFVRDCATTTRPTYETVRDVARWIVTGDRPVQDADVLAEQVRLAFWDAMEHGAGEIDFNDAQVAAVVAAFGVRLAEGASS